MAFGQPAATPAPTTAPAAPTTAPAPPQAPVGPVGQVQQSGGLPEVPAYAVAPQAPVTPPPANTNIPEPNYMQQLLHQNQQMMSHFMNTSAPAPEATPAPTYTPFEYQPPTAVEFTDEHRTLLGTTVPAVTAAARHEAMQMIAPLIEQINSMGQQAFDMNNKFGAVENQITGTQKQIYNSALAAAVPNLNEIINTPQFQQFAGQRYSMYGQDTIKDALSAANARQDTAGVLNIIRQFQAGQQPQQQQVQPLQHHTNQTSNPGMFTAQQAPVQAPPMQNYMQPLGTPTTQQFQQTPTSNQALIQQEYEQAKTRLEAEKTPAAQQAYSAAAAKMFQMQMGLPT